MDYPEYVALYFYLTRKTYPADASHAVKRRIAAKSKRYTPFKGKLFTKSNDNDENTNDQLGKEVLHEGNIHEIISKVHADGHFGIRNTYHKVSLQYEGKAMYEQVGNVVKSCEICQKRQKIQHKKIIKMRPIPTVHRPFFMIGLDAVGPLEVTKNGNRFMLVCVDYLTRWPIAAACKDITAKTAEEFLMDNVFMHHGVPTYLLTDRGSSFKAEYIDYVLKKMECRHLLSCAYKPSTNGAVERLNMSIVNTMAKLRLEDGNEQDWDKYVNKALFCLRTMVNETTSFTPAMLLYGYELRTPANWPAPRYDYVEGEIEVEVARRTKEIDQYVSALREQAIENANKKKLKMKARYDKDIIQEVRRFEIGEKVLMKNHVLGHKFDYKWLGPYTITVVNKNHTYHLMGPNSRKLDGAVNGNYLLPFRESSRMIPGVKDRRKIDAASEWLERS